MLLIFNDHRAAFVRGYMHHVLEMMLLYVLYKFVSYNIHELHTIKYLCALGDFVQSNQSNSHLTRCIIYFFWFFFFTTLLPILDTCMYCT